MYSVAALGKEGGQHMASILKIQLKQVMEQVCCGKVGELGRFLVT
jgi:L-lactate dehydrogenase (cytochrome)